MRQPPTVAWSRGQRGMLASGLAQATTSLPSRTSLIAQMGPPTTEGAEVCPDTHRAGPRD